MAPDKPKKTERAMNWPDYHHDKDPGLWAQREFDEAG